MASHSLDVLSRFSPPVPPALAERARVFAAARPSAPEQAASVVLLREEAAGLETFLLHRHDRMPFAASMVVFPGGRVDYDDQRDPDVRRACAVRETWEETGVRLRQQDLLPWAHWVTPEPEPRRYDTYFYVAALPKGQVAADVSGETESAEWARPADALRRWRDGVIGLMPPTLSILLELDELGSLAGVCAAAAERVVVAVLPRVEQTATGWRYRYPVRVEELDR